MMTGDVQWDSQLGGTQSLPNSIHLLGHASARSTELAQMHAHLFASSSNHRTGHSAKLAFQRIPHHMRRRAMSHNVRRLPRRLRNIHEAQMRKSRNGRTDADLQAQMRRPSRKYRRRPTNLIAEYTRRRTNVHWLHTHIWHAKRFHMELRWGWKIPVRPTARAYRANYRAAAKHCLIQDISFVSCVQLEGSQEDIVNGFLKISDTSDLCVGTTNLTATSIIRGNREGTIHCRDITTNHPIGLVPFHWRPLSSNNNLRAIWLWVNPSYYNQFMTNLYKVFLTTPEPLSVNSDDCIVLDNGVTITSLRHELARFRIRGPLATCVLQKALRSQRKQDKWWEELSTTTAHCFSPRSVVELMVTDPRLSFPQKRTKATVRVMNSDDMDLPIVKLEKQDATTDQSNSQPLSPLWDPTIRRDIITNRESNASLAHRRGQLLVPGSIPESPPPQQIPMLLIQHPGIASRGFASGWDVILPTSYAQATWLALVLWGGRAGGVQDAEHLQLEATDVRDAIYLHPDTAAGKMEEERRGVEVEKRYWARPPNRRCSYGKLGVVSPFRAMWGKLVKEWCKGKHEEEFKVMRKGRDLEVIAEALDCSPKLKWTKKLPFLYKFREIRPTIQNLQTKHILPKLSYRTINHSQLLTNLNFSQPLLLHIRLTLSGRGHCSPNALICLPHSEDFTNQSIIEETLRSNDANELARKKLRLKHWANLRREKRRRKTAKLSGTKTVSSSLSLEEYRDTMRELWVPTLNVPTVRNSCSREVIGWVTDAKFSFLCGRWVALGYVVLPAVEFALQQKGKKELLVRDSQSRCYRFAEVEVLHRS